MDSREEVARKKEEYMNDKELEKIYQECKKAEVIYQKSGFTHAASFKIFLHGQQLTTQKL